MKKMTREDILKELELYEYEPDKLSRETLVEALEHYYEAAGFNDVRKNKLDEKSDDELRELYKDTIPKKSKEDEVQF